MLRQHGKHFGHAPRVLAGDRGLFSPENESLARHLGVEEIAIPQTGERSPERMAYEKQPWFKQAQCFRNGIEGRKVVLLSEPLVSWNALCNYGAALLTEKWASSGGLVWVSSLPI